MDREELIAYWINSSDRDFKTMQHLFEKKDYHWCLFIGHLVIEKLLKAYYVKTVNLHPPFIHDLLRLAVKSRLALSTEQKDTLDILSTFNISARYPDMMIINCNFTNSAQKNIQKNGIRESRILEHG